MNSDEDTNDTFPDQDLFVADNEEHEPTLFERVRKVAIVIVSIIVISGMLSLSGVYQALLYHETSPTVVQQEVPMLLDATSIRVPLTVYIIRNEEELGSSRTVSSIDLFVRNADVIWNQANIDLTTVAIVEVELTDSEISAFINDPFPRVTTLPGYNKDTVSVVLVRSIRGINGLAYTGARTILVADFTTVIDFRTLAHEVGHVLGLGHVPGDRGRLMYRGANGFELSIEEVITARSHANRL